MAFAPIEWFYRWIIAYEFHIRTQIYSKYNGNKSIVQ